MVALYIGGHKIDWADAERVLAHRAPDAAPVELRTDEGKVLGVVVPGVPAPGDDPDWVKAMTPEEIERRMAGEFITFEELKKRLGWQ